MIRAARAILLYAGLPVAASLAPGQAEIMDSMMNDEMTLWYDTPAKEWEREALPIGNGRLGGMIFGGVDREHIQFNEDTLWIGDEEDTGSYQAFGDLFIALGQVEEKADVSNPSGHSTSKKQTVASSVDGNPQTKWCTEHKGRPVVWQIDYPSASARLVREYAFTSANDVPTRDPQVWRLEGSNDGKHWVVLDERKLHEPFSERHLKQRFSIENEKAFSSYRFTFEPVDPTHFQVADIKLSGTAEAAPQGYRRELDIRNALHTIVYEKDGTNYRRDYFASHPAGVLVFRLSADRKGAYSGVLSLQGAHDGMVRTEDGTLMFYGMLSGKYGKPDENYAIRLQYEAQVRVINEGGSLEFHDDRIAFRDCDSLLILLAGGTDYLNRHDKGWLQEHPHERVTDTLSKASQRTYDELLQEHVADYRALYNRLELDVGRSADEVSGLPTDQRIIAYKAGGKDPDLEELLFQYARYLMISSSRPGCLPANLQGLWNNQNRPPWRSDYHTDVNIQMNYWFVDRANLSECFTPLSEWLWSVVPVKREATREAFNARGWAHRAENGIFGGATFKWYLGDAAWIMQNIWDHYAFTRDREYLETRAYPLLKELCEFWEDTLIEWPGGELVSPKSQSPEHGPETEGNSYEQQLVYDLFSNYIEASTVLGVDSEFREKVASMRERLLKPRIGKWGQLQEWAEDMDDPNDQHRHLSHLIAVHPGRQISPITTPELAEAAKVSMNARGDGATGWSKAWKINIWARLHDGNRAYKLLNEQIKGNFYGNLFGYHPPFQIDGNFGYASGVCEMLLQSQTGDLHLLPALPDAWSNGSVSGLRARGDYTVDIRWDGGVLKEATIHAGKRSEGNARVRYGDGSVTLALKPGESRTLQLKDIKP